MPYDFDKVTNRRGTGSVKYDGLKSYFGREELIPMWVADMDFKAPECVTSEIIKRAEHGIFGYPVVADGFYTSIIDWLDNRHNWKVDRESILFTPGIVPALTMSVMVYSEPGDKILLQSPVYPPFFSSIRANGRVLVNSRLVEDNGYYRIDFDDLEKKLADGVKLMFFCNPHNPVGRVWTREEVRKVVDLCNHYGVTLVSDEIHSDLIFPGYQHIPASNAGAGDRGMVVCMAPSKTFNLAGMASAFLVIPDRRLRLKMRKILENLHIHYGTIFGLTALQAAYEKGEGWLEALISYLKENRDLTGSFFESSMPVIKPVKAEGTYLLWLDCRGMGMKDAELKSFFIEKAGVAMNPGPSFGEGGAGFHRMNIGCPRSVLKEVLNRIRNAWDGKP